MLYIFLADGFEETEAIATFDVVKRANIPVTLVGVNEKDITSTRGVTVCCEIMIDEIDFNDIEGIILPGGMPGTLNLKNNAILKEIIEHCDKNNKLIASICAAPMIIGEMELLKNRAATCYPGYEDSLIGADIQDSEHLVIDKNIITAKGAADALVFGAAIIDYVKGEGNGDKILKQLQYTFV